MFHSLVSLRIMFATLGASMHLLQAVALKALESGRTICVPIAVSLAHLTLVPRSAATGAEIIHSHGIVAVVLAHIS